jgi:hypothetical protein
MVILIRKTGRLVSFGADANYLFPFIYTFIVTLAGAVMFEIFAVVSLYEAMYDA